MNADERRKLKDQVTDMVRMGYTYEKIAHQLGITKRTICKYVKAERKEAIEQLHATAEEHMADYESEKNKRIMKLWTIALDEKNTPGERTKAISLLQNEETMGIKRKQLIGLLPQEAPLVAIQNNNMIEGVTTIADSIRRKCPELLEKFHKNKMKVLKDMKEEKHG